MSNTFTPGQNVYDTDGYCARYVCHDATGHIVVPYSETDDGPIEGKAEAWVNVYATPPTAKRHAEVAALTEQLAELRHQAGIARTDLANAKQEYTALAAKAQKYAALKRIDEYLDGKFKYFVTSCSYGAPKVVAFSSAVKDTTERWSKDLQLVVLFGRSNGNLQWKINQYYDGSGSWTDVVPCETEEEGIEIIRQRCNELAEAWRADHTKGRDILYWAKQLPPEWNAIPEDVLAHIRDEEHKTLLNCVTAAESQLAAAREALNKAEATRPDQGTMAATWEVEVQ